MKRVYTGQVFSGLSDRNSGSLFTDLEFDHCSFVSCFLSRTNNPKRRSKVKNVRLTKCEVRGCTVYSSEIEEVVIDGLKTHQLLQTFGAVYRHVTLRGTIGRIMISPLVDPLKPRSEIQESFDRINNEFYAKTDWALDISEASFVECDIRRLPAHLVRRDPLTQVVVKRDTLMLREWRKLDLGTYVPGILELFLEEGDSDLVLVAPKSSSLFSRYAEGIERLRNTGIAEPD